MKSTLGKMGMALLVALVLSACGGGYFKVTEPVTGKIYYTDDLNREDNGSVRLVDAATGSSVTLQSSEVKEITSEEFRANTKKK